MMAESTSSPPHQFNGNGTRKTHLGRSDSLVSLARAPFSVQLHRLTSLSLPSPDSLHTRILDAASPQESLSRLRNIATDVHKWISTASTVLGQLDADDDVEWAARGKDSLAKVENASRRFGEIVEIFLDAATILSARSDDSVKGEIKELIDIMDDVTHGWGHVRELLKGLKEQVALSTEWMEIREILDDISDELDACANMVFELEEQRHFNQKQPATLSADGASPSSASSPTELDRLTTILEQHSTPASNSHKASLLRLSARIQPLHASLDFLQPRLSSFSERAAKTFPTALDEVLQRKEDLQTRWKKVESDWRGLGRELQEDEWIEVFRKVGQQATDMMDSISRSMMALSIFLPNTAPSAEFLEHYLGKRAYYPTAISRVLDILDRGYKNRVTVNGEIGRNYDDLRDRWMQVQRQMAEIDEYLKKLGLTTPTDDLSNQVKGLSIITEGSRPRSAGSNSTTTTSATLTQGAVSPTGAASSRASSIRSGNRVSSLPPPPSARRESIVGPTGRNRSVSSTTSSSPRTSRLHVPIFTPRSKSSSVGRLNQSPTGTGGLIPIEARPRWNASPIANVLGSPHPKIPSVVVTPSRIPRSGRASPTKVPTATPSRLTRPTTPSSNSPNKRIPVAIGRGTPPSSLSRMVSNPSLPRNPSQETPSKLPDIRAGRRQTANFSNLSAINTKPTAIPRPSTSLGMNGRNVSGSASNTPVQPRWRG